MDNSHAAGTALGAIIGFYKSISGISLLAFLTWNTVLDTVILAFIGGVLGWCGTELMKLIKKKLQGK